MKNKKRTAILILGMHRSGTSALTRVLNLLGCDIAKDLIPPAPDNPKGFWESDSIWDINDRILQYYGSRWYDCCPIDNKFRETSFEQEFIAEIVHILEKQFSQSSLFVIKDPRIGRLQHLWIRALEQFGAEIRAIHVFRHPKEVAASLSARQECPEDYGCLLWSRYVLDSEFGSRTLTRTFLSFDSLLADWRSAISKIQIGIGKFLPTSLGAEQEQIDRFLDAGDRHHHTKKEEAKDAAPYWQMAEILLQRMIEAEGVKQEPQGLRVDFDLVSSHFGAMFTGGAAILSTMRDFWFTNNRRLTQEKNNFERAYNELLAERNDWAKSQNFLTQERDAWHAAHEELKNFSENALQQFMQHSKRTHEDYVTQTSKALDEFQLFNNKSHDDFLSYSQKALADYDAFVQKERESWKESQANSQKAFADYDAFVQKERESWKESHTNLLAHLALETEN